MPRSASQGKQGVKPVTLFYFLWPLYKPARAGDRVTLARARDKDAKPGAPARRCGRCPNSKMDSILSRNRALTCRPELVLPRGSCVLMLPCHLLFVSCSACCCPVVSRATTGTSLSPQKLSTSWLVVSTWVFSPQKGKHLVRKRYLPLGFGVG